MSKKSRSGKKVRAASRKTATVQNSEYVYKGRVLSAVQKVKKRGCGCAGKKAGSS
ncbi:hypothetical protein JSY36_09825 [Bacillus sp. H-16]|uniref:hypothetical protein n=1 Tax=Alteribacter salitolerans TaxID=2912333 RepID=UPI001966638C|nr:hypothetical protein [Alteribacter salitolerans]MBM7096053.1 hypothetical protein [Alteribacter salitolerans]